METIKGIAEKKYPDRPGKHWVRTLAKAQREAFIAGAESVNQDKDKEINRLRELLRITNAPLMWLSTLDKMPTLDLLDREGVINFVVKTAKEKVIGPQHDDWKTLTDRI